MSKPRLLLIGAGGHAHACIDVIEQLGTYQIVGLIGLPNEIHAKHLDYEVIGADKDLTTLAKTCPWALITLGQIQTPDHRIRLFQFAKMLGFQLPSFIASSAHVSQHAIIGAGTVVMHGAIVNAGAKIGDNCIINSQALIEHDATVADHCHISTGAILNGGTTIKTGCFVGSGALLKEGISIGERCVISMGLIVRHNQSDHTKLTRNTHS